MEYKGYTIIISDSAVYVWKNKTLIIKTETEYEAIQYIKELKRK